MDPNDFGVVNKPAPPKFKASSGRSVRELRAETAQLEQERRDMELRLQELRRAMSREKEERKKLGAFRWKSAHVGLVSALSRGHAETKENSGHKFSTGRMKIRVLKQEPEVELKRPAAKLPRPPLMPPPPIAGNVVSSRKSKLRGKPCGQCETRAAGLMCTECGEDYCVGCFARFHQKGALKHHTMIPMKMEIRTSISALDVLSRFSRQIDADETSVPVWEAGTATREAPCVAPAHIQSDEVSAQEGWKEVGPCKANPGGQGATLLSGEFDEEESARSFQEALKKWRQVGEQACCSEEDLPVSREVAATQVNLTQWRPPIQVKFQDHGLSYMERLLVKKHRRSPMEEPRPPPSMDSAVKSLDVSQLTDEECPGLTAEEMDMKRYCASLFTTAAAGSCNQPERRTQSSLRFEEEMDGMVGGFVPTTSFAAEWRAESKDIHGAQEAGAADLKALDSRNHGNTIWTQSTQPLELDLSSKVRSTKTRSTFTAPLTQTSGPVLPSMTPIYRSPETDLFTETTASQSPELHLSFRNPLTQSSEHVRSFSPQMTQLPEPDLSFKTPVAQSDEPDLSSTTSVTQSAEKVLSSRSTVTPSPKHVLSSVTRMNQSPEPVLSFTTQMSKTPETDLFTKTPLTQSLEPHLSLKGQTIQSLEPKLSSRTSVVQSPEPDVFSKASVTQSPEPALISMTSVFQSLEPNLSCRTQVTQSAEPDLPSGCKTMRSPEDGLISAKFPHPQPPLSAPCGPGHSPRPPFRLRSAPALRSSFSAGEFCCSLDAPLSGSWCHGQAETGDPDLFKPIFELASPPALGDCSDLACWSEPDAGPGMRQELSKALCSLSCGELTQLDWNSDLVPIAGNGARLQAPCSPVDHTAGMSSPDGADGQLLREQEEIQSSQPLSFHPTAAQAALSAHSLQSHGTGPRPWLDQGGGCGLEISQPLSPSFSPPLSPPQHPCLSSWSLSMSFSPPHSPSVPKSLSPHLAQPFTPNVCQAHTPPPTPPLSQPHSPPLTLPLKPLPPRPRSRAAQEIQDIQGVDSALSDICSLEEEADHLTLACLEEELRHMSAEARSPALGMCADVTPCDPRRPPPWRRTSGSARLEDGEDHTDEEDEADGDRKSVLSLR